MKNVFPFVLSLICFAYNAYGQQATIALNNFDADKPIYYVDIGASVLAPVGQTYVQLLGGIDGNNLKPVVIADTSESTLSLTSPGYFDAGIGIIPGVEPMDNAVLQLRCWRNGNSFEQATYRAIIQWTQLVGYWSDLSEPPVPPTGPVLAIPSNIYLQRGGSIPEPSSFALLTIGIVTLATRHRRFMQSRVK